MASEHCLTADNSSTKRRVQGACDACRARKVKCNYDNGQLSCQACHDLNVDCTQEQPRKRRGPPSRYFEDEQRRKRQQELLPRTPPVLWDTPGQLHHSQGLEQLAPLVVIQQVVNDWFDLVHPVAPILHRESFIRQLNNVCDQHEQDFICLVASICAATVTTLRRRAAEYAAVVTVNKCCQIIRDTDQARDRDLPISLLQCQIKYNMAVALAAEKGMDHSQSQIMMAGATAIVGHLVHYDMQNLVNCDRELVKRLYWLCFAAQCTFGLHGRPYFMPVSAFADIEALRPRDLNDKELGDIIPSDGTWHGHSRSYIPGLNALIDLFILWYRSQQGHTSSLTHLQSYLDQVMSSLDYIPPELRWRGGLSRTPRSNFGTDVQMVNLYITQIHIRSFLLDQMASALQNSQDATALSNVVSSQQDLVNDMLAIVYQMPEDTLEANGNSLIFKLRDIGLALLNDSSSETAFVNLDRLLAKLERLDIRPGSQVDSTSPMTTLTSPGFPS